MLAVNGAFVAFDFYSAAVSNPAEQLRATLGAEAPTDPSTREVVLARAANYRA